MKLTEITLQSWAIYESNVQQYRAFSATVQSFFLAVGAILFTANDVPAALLLLISLFGVLHATAIWMRAVISRNYVVDYYKFQCKREFDDDKIRKLMNACSEKEYVNSKAKREKVNAEFFGEHDVRMFRPTRRKMDIYVPMSYVAIWAALDLWKFGHLIGV